MTAAEAGTLQELQTAADCAGLEMEFLELKHDAGRWLFLAEHWHSLMGGVPLHRWLDERALRRGGVTAALDYAMNYHYSGERHIA